MLNLTENKKGFTRLAFLEEYCGYPERLLKYIPEIKRKGYGGVALSARIGEIDHLRALVAKSIKHDLEVWVFTGYMKYYPPGHLKEHPEQRVVVSTSEGLKPIQWGCPFNPEFKKWYLKFLQEIAEIEGITAIWVNDEAHLRGGCYCSVCQKEYEREFGGEIPLFNNIDNQTWKDMSWRQFLLWRIERWNRIHKEMKETINKINPHILTLFQSSPLAGDLTGVNPWYSCVCLPWMVEYLDGISVDPYYTAHGHLFHPPEVYMSEWCRFLAGIVPERKISAIITQGFTHPTFTRPLEKKDGLWTAIVPLACRIRKTTAYTYPLMKCAKEFLTTYENSFRFDNLFAQAQPLRYTGIVHSSSSEIFYQPLPYERETFDVNRILSCTESLRHYGIPYSYISDRLLNLEGLQHYKTVILPDVACLNKSQSDIIREFYLQGGNLVVLGTLGCADSTGKEKKVSLLEEIFGIRVKERPLSSFPLSFITSHPISNKIPSYNDRKTTPRIDSLKPQLMFTNCVRIEVNKEKTEILAEFLDSNGEPTGNPAIVLPVRKDTSGRAIYLAGFPSRYTHHPRYSTYIRNLSNLLFSEIVRWVCGTLPCIRVLDWPPVVPMERIRPYDIRYINTYEFFPLLGKDFYLAVITSYFKEPAKFNLSADIPEGRTISEVKELVSGKDVDYHILNGEVTIPVNFKSRDYLKIFLIRFAL